MCSIPVQTASASGNKTFLSSESGPQFRYHNMTLFFSDKGRIRGINCNSPCGFFGSLTVYNFDESSESFSTS